MGFSELGYMEAMTADQRMWFQAKYCREMQSPGVGLHIDIACVIRTDIDSYNLVKMP